MKQYHHSTTMKQYNIRCLLGLKAESNASTSVHNEETIVHIQLEALYVHTLR